MESTVRLPWRFDNVILFTWKGYNSDFCVNGSKRIARNSRDLSGRTRNVIASRHHWRASRLRVSRTCVDNNFSPRTIYRLWRGHSWPCLLVARNSEECVGAATRSISICLSRGKLNSLRSLQISVITHHVLVRSVRSDT